MEQLQELMAQVAQSPATTVVVALACALTLGSAIRFLARLLGGLYTHFLRRGLNLRNYGQWAVVTGATDGIGRAYADALAKQKLRLVLISRTPSRLDEAAQAITDKYGVEVRTIPADLTSTDDAMFDRIQAGLKDLDIGILVNNAGMSFGHPEYHHLLDDKVVQDVIVINTISLTRLCRLVLGGMKERGRGLVVNVGSGAASAIPSGPLLATYTATKAYVDSFSRSLDDEYREFGVRVQNQAPLFVATKMSKIRRARIDAPTPETWAAAAVKAMGRETVSIPYWFHALQAAVVRVLPSSLVQYQVMQIHRSLRRAAYKKKARASRSNGLADSGAVNGEAKKDA